MIIEDRFRSTYTVIEILIRVTREASRVARRNLRPENCHQFEASLELHRVHTSQPLLRSCTNKRKGRLGEMGGAGWGPPSSVLDLESISSSEKMH